MDVVTTQHRGFGELFYIGVSERDSVPFKHSNRYNWRENGLMFTVMVFVFICSYIMIKNSFKSVIRQRIWAFNIDTA